MNGLTRLGDVDYFAVTAAALIRLPLAALWHSPLMFGRTWSRDVGLTARQMRSRPLPALFALAFAASLCGAFVLALLLGPEPGLATGTLAGLLAGLGIAGGAVVSSMAFEARPRTLIAMDAGFHILIFTVTGAVVGAW